MKKSDLKKLYKNGLISASVFQYLEMRDKVMQYKKQGMSLTEAVAHTAKISGRSKRTIWRAMSMTKGLKIT